MILNEKMNYQENILIQINIEKKLNKKISGKFYIMIVFLLLML